MAHHANMSTGHGAEKRTERRDPGRLGMSLSRIAERAGLRRLAMRFAQSLACGRPRCAKLVLRAARLAWWAVSLQLVWRFRAWQLVRRAATRTTPAVALPPIPTPDAICVRGADHPAVSVIIPTYGQVAHTLRCLAAIAACPPAAPIEVIVVDDASDDPEVADLARVQGIRLIRHTRNMGFLCTCNAAAVCARAPALMFLNNDTIPHAGWLDAMLDLLSARPDAGAVGAKLLYPDGRLQEAGGIIWNDATGWNYGRGDVADRPEYNYVREVDYCSGAALLVRASLFRRLRGFDPAYTPAYFEDSDLAFRLRVLGYKTLYQPRAEVVHVEGVSHGTDTRYGVKAYQERNRDQFIARWADILAGGQTDPGTQVMRARERALARPVVLVIDHAVPEPDRDAGSCTVWAFIQTLLEAGAVVKFWSDAGRVQPLAAAALQELGVEVRVGGWQAFIPWIAEHGDALDHVLLSRPHVADRYLIPLRRLSRARVTFYGHDLHHDRLRQRGQSHAARRMLRLERHVWRQVDTVLYPSWDEADRVAALEPHTVVRAVQPYIFTAPEPPRLPAPPRPSDMGDTVLFVAGFAHPPNEVAARWLAAEIMPLVRQYVPSAQLAIVGSCPTDTVRALAGPRVTVAADVSPGELREWYARARVAVVPLRQGAGVKRKVAEALHEGLPLVTTPIGAQGLPGLDAVAEICETAETIAAAIGDLLRDDLAWRQRSAAGRAYARRRFSPEGMRVSLLGALGLPGLALPAEAAEHREALVQVGDQVRHILEPDMQPHHGSLEVHGTGGAGDEATGG
jgi:GT2 family glycosyltransferase